ncbi:MAG: GGDEF domain-containing protein [Betaproteobacteria bacterium]|nr:GGDEF domain-containing protein [Betaproteobacteria bacterium]
MNRGQTLVLALLVMNFLLGFLCVTVARGERDSPALRQWGVGMLMYAFGLLITQQRYLPLELVALVGNGLIAWAPVWSVRGTLAHSARQLNVRWTRIGLFATLAILAANNLWWHSALVNFTAPSPIAIVLFSVGAVCLLRSPPDDAAHAARFAAGVMIFSVVVWILRFAFLFNVLDWNSDRDVADLTIALFAIAQLVSGVACTMALFWIEVRRMEAALCKVAFNDALTDLPNRRAILARFREEVARAARAGQPLALMVMDLDHFKRINDSHGHQTGDAVLKHAALTLASVKRSEDVLARIGGEEFVVVLPNQSAESAFNTAERFRIRLAETACEIDGLRLHATLSGGVAMYPDDGSDWDSLFAAADRRCYAAKQAGRNRVNGPHG